MTYSIEENIEIQRKNLSDLGIEKDPKTLAERIKAYEGVSSIRLDRNMPVIIRVDGKNFSKYTKKFNKPFDDLLVHAMQHCAKKVSEELQSFQLAYHQSDEISFLVWNRGKENSDIAFGGKVNKINSLCASYMAGYFNKFMSDYADKNLSKQLAFFDCRCFNIPLSDVSNYFLHRAKDWERNSVTMLGRHYFSHKEMHGKNRNEIKSRLFSEKDVDWNDLIDDLKYGTFIYKRIDQFVHSNFKAEYSIIDNFLKEDIGIN